MGNPSFRTSASPVAVDPASDSTLQFDTTQSLELPAYKPGSDSTLQYDLTQKLELPAYKPGELVDPIFTTDSPVALEDYTIGVTSLDLPIEGFKPSPDLDSNTLIAATDGSLGAVAVEKTPLPEKDITLDTFKAATGELSSDTNLSKEAQDYFRQLAKVPLKADDWKIVNTRASDSAVPKHKFRMPAGNNYPNRPGKRSRESTPLSNTGAHLRATRALILAILPPPSPKLSSA